MSTETIIVEISGGHGSGRTVSRERLTLDANRRSFTIGRSVSADLTLDDEHVAALHASVEVASDGRITVDDLGSANGIFVDGKRHHGRVPLPSATSKLQIGRSSVRIRTGYETLPPERLVDPGFGLLGDRAGTVAAVAAGVCLLQAIYSVWLGAPRDVVAALATTIGGSALILAIWVAAWGLLSRILLGEWHWLRHGAIFLGAVALYWLATAAGDLSSYMLSYAPWADQRLWLGLTAIAAALGLHLTNASSLSARRATLAAATAFALLGGGGVWFQTRDQVKNVNLINSRFQIYPAGLRLREAETLDAFFKDARALRVATDRKRDVARASDSEGASGPF